MTSRIRLNRAVAGLTGLILFGGCSFFSAPPPLPRQAAIERGSSDEKFASLIEDADIIYFPSEAFVLSHRTDPGWRLLEALRRSGNGLAIGADSNAPAESRRVLLAEAKKSEATVLELRKADQVTAEQTLEGFTTPPGDYERFARRPEFREVAETRVRAAYEAELLAQQFAAGTIATYAKEHGNDKILVIMRRSQLAEAYGVPYFVAQKTRARQLVLNPEERPRSGPGLLAWRGGGCRSSLNGGAFDIVNGAPWAGANQRGLVLPRPTAGSIVELLLPTPE
jgi:hypothetical protein